MRVVVRGPAVRGEADGDEQAAWQHEGDAEFGAAGGGVMVFEVDVDLWEGGGLAGLGKGGGGLEKAYAVVDGGADLQAEHEAEAQREIVEGGHGEGHVVFVFEDEGEGGEAGGGVWLVSGMPADAGAWGGERKGVVAYTRYMTP